MQNRLRQSRWPWGDRAGQTLDRACGILKDRAWLIGCLLVCLIILAPIALLEPASLSDLREPFERAEMARLKKLKQRIPLQRVPNRRSRSDAAVQHVGWNDLSDEDMPDETDPLATADKIESRASAPLPARTKQAAWLTGTLDYVVE